MYNAEMKQAIKTLTSIGLVNTTSKRQLANGTLEFSDPQEKDRYNKSVKYTLHANGYYRKGNYVAWTRNYDMYQLNRTKKVKRMSQWGECTDIVRVLIPGQYEVMAARIVSIAINSRRRTLLATVYTNR